MKSAHIAITEVTRINSFKTSVQGRMAGNESGLEEWEVMGRGIEAQRPCRVRSLHLTFLIHNNFVYFIQNP